MKANSTLFHWFLLVCIYVYPQTGRAQVVLDRMQSVEISKAATSTVTIASVTMAPMRLQVAQVVLDCTNKTDAALKATAFCHVACVKDGKTLHEAFSFHDIEIQKGKSQCTVVFSTSPEMSLKGEGTIKIYLADRIAPKPKPGGAWFGTAKGIVHYLDRPIGQVYEKLQIHQVSNTLSLPAKTTDQETNIVPDPE